MDFGIDDHASLVVYLTDIRSMITHIVEPGDSGLTAIDLNLGTNNSSMKIEKCHWSNNSLDVSTEPGSCVVGKPNR